MANILIIDDDRTQRQLCMAALGNHSLWEAEGCAAAMLRLGDASQPAIDLVLLDYYMPETDGRESLGRIRARYPALPVIMVTSNETLDEAVRLMREGASDYIAKPFAQERLRLSVEQQLELRSLKSEVETLKRQTGSMLRFEDAIGSQTGLSPCVALARKAARSNIAVLIGGESGTGKELIARAIHGESTRGNAPFIAVNCGAIPENLVESVLFGHEKGAFTGAIAREIGKFREAEGGTLLLDEVGELKPAIQTKLLRALQQREIEPVGAGKPVAVNVRILSATHRDLAQDVRDGRFREDLFYRLNVLPIHVPPLRERVADIAALTAYMLKVFCQRERMPLVRVSDAGVAWLNGQNWPGNVRELENLLHRAVVLTEKSILEPADFDAMTQSAPARRAAPLHAVSLLDASGTPRSMDDLESEIIDWAVRHCEGSVPRAARTLGIGQSTLYKKLAGSAA